MTYHEEETKEAQFHRVLAESIGKIECIVSGAGVSFLSKCPSGDQLKGFVWDMLTDSFQDEPVIRQRLKDARNKIVDSSYFRMEQLVHLMYMNDESNKKRYHYAFHYAYQVLACGYRPNRNHWYITHAENVQELLTLNMDDLIEKAQETGDDRRVVHLHGVATDPKNIKTTPDEYFQELPERASFQQAVEGKTVLVVGYSGRDVDVMPLFEDYHPRKLIWLNHDPGDPPSVELLRLHDRLKGTVDFPIIYGDTELFLAGITGRACPKKFLNPGGPGDPVGDTERRVQATQEALAKKLSASNGEYRKLVACMALAELNENDSIRVILDCKFRARDYERRRRKQLSRVEKNEWNYKASRKHLRAVPFTRRWMEGAVERGDTYRLENRLALATIHCRAAYHYVRVICRLPVIGKQDDLRKTYVKLNHQLIRGATLSGRIKGSLKLLERTCQAVFGISLEAYFRNLPDWKKACSQYGAYIVSLFHERLSMVYLALQKYPTALFCADRYLEMVQYSQPSMVPLAWRTVLSVMMEGWLFTQEKNPALEKRFLEYRDKCPPEYLSGQNQAWLTIMEAEYAMLTGDFSWGEWAEKFSGDIKTTEKYSALIIRIMLICWESLRDGRWDVADQLSLCLPRCFENRVFAQNYRHWLHMLSAAFLLYHGKPAQSYAKRLKKAERYFRGTRSLSMMSNASFLLEKASGGERISEKELLRVIFVMP